MRKLRSLHQVHFKRFHNGTHMPCSLQSPHYKEIGMITSIWNLPVSSSIHDTRTVIPLMSTEENSGGWSEDPLHGKEEPVHNIQPRQEHSPGGRCVTVRVYNQEKTIESKYRGFTTRCKQGQIRLCQTHLKKPDSFLKSILWLAEININLYPNNGKKKVWGRLGTAHDPKHTTSSVKHGGAVWWHEHAWLPVALCYWCVYWWCDRRQKKSD